MSHGRENVDADVARVVLKYLSDKGYHQVATQLRQELQHHAVQSPAGQFPLWFKGLDKDRAVGDHVIFWGMLEGDPTRIVNSYASLQDFIAGSLELYRTELSTVSFPVFMHLFLDLVSRGFVNEAGAFMERWGGEHEEHYLDEINELRKVKTFEQIAENEFVTRMCDSSNRFVLEMSKPSFQLLHGYATNAGDTIIMTVLNRRVKINIVNQPPMQHFRVAPCGLDAEKEMAGVSRQGVAHEPTSSNTKFGAPPAPLVAAAAAAAREGLPPYQAGAVAGAPVAGTAAVGAAGAAVGRPVPPSALAAAMASTGSGAGSAPELFSPFDSAIARQLVMRPLGTPGLKPGTNSRALAAAGARAAAVASTAAAAAAAAEATLAIAAAGGGAGGAATADEGA
ncbi:unnamed protein product, partial [Phaeothamnion confervicola]